MNNAEIIEYQRKERQLRETPVGAALLKFERRLERAWSLDGQENTSYRRTREAFEAASAAREELLILLRPLIGLGEGGE